MTKSEGDPHGPRIVQTFHKAVDLLDKSEPKVRDLIETNLMDVAGINKTKVSDALLSRDELTKAISAVRHQHVKVAFRHLRDNLPAEEPEPPKAGEEPGEIGPLRIHGNTLGTWARAIAEQDTARIHSAISVGLTAGEDNTDIAHRVIGSRRMNGVNGATEITRQHIFRLGRGLLHKRKTRMSGASTDVR